MEQKTALVVAHYSNDQYEYDGVFATEEEFLLWLAEENKERDCKATWEQYDNMSMDEQIEYAIKQGHPIPYSPQEFAITMTTYFVLGGV